MTAAAIIETRHASLVYPTPRGPITAVDDVSLAIAPGECVAIEGRSGSGKSTLLALLAGLCRPSSGEVWFAGRPWRDRSAAETSGLRSSGIGLVLQDAALLPGLRAIDNVLLPAVLAGSGRAAAAARAAELLRLVGLGDRWDAHPAELSGGQQRRVALARALAAKPRVILADEPTGDLDALAAREIAALLDRLRADRSTAIVVVTHDPALAAIADRRLWMDRGGCSPAVTGAAIGAGAAAIVPGPSRDAGEPAFEPAPAGLAAAAPETAVGSVVGAWLPFLAGVAICGAGVAVIDGVVARRQEAVVKTVRARRRLAEEMALQDLRADIDDVTVAADGRAEVTVYLQNFRPERPLHVLGPALSIAIQREGRWADVPIAAVEAAGGIRTITGEKTLLQLGFAVSQEPYDELLRGYLHVRVAAAMVVGDRPDGAGDLFERQDAYFIYLRDPRRTEDEIRRANGWGQKATVPVWISMPSH